MSRLARISSQTDPNGINTSAVRMEMEPPLKRQFLGLFSSRVIATTIQAVTFIILARLLEVHELGVVGVVISIGAFIAMLTDFGMSTLTSKSRAIGDNRIVRSALRFNNITAFTIGTIGCVTIIFVNAFSAEAIALGILFIALLFERNAETSLSVPFADGNAIAPAISIVGRRVTAIVTLLILLFSGIGALLAYCVGQLAGAAFGFLHKSIVEHRTVRSDGSYMSFFSVLRKSWPYWLSAVSNQARVLDAALVGGLLGSYAAGIYLAAMKIVNPLNMIPIALASILLPHAARVDANTVATLTRKIVLLFLSMYFVLIIPIVFSTQIIVFILGEQYRESGPILALAFAILPLLGLASPLNGILQARDGERYAAYNSMVFGVIIVVAIAVCALLFGTAGVVIAIGATCLLRCISLLLAISKLPKGVDPLSTSTAV